MKKKHITCPMAEGRKHRKCYSGATQACVIFFYTPNGFENNRNVLIIQSQTIENLEA